MPLWDIPGRNVRLGNGDSVPYDTLLVATGARHHYFNHPEWEPLAPGLKTVEDATGIRRRILQAFEAAEATTDPAEVPAWLTFVIVGAGPTGVELAGAIAELAHHTLRGNFRKILQFIKPFRRRLILAIGIAVLLNLIGQIPPWITRFSLIASLRARKGICS